MGLGPGASSNDKHNNLIHTSESSCRNWAPAQVEDRNCRLSLRVLTGQDQKAAEIPGTPPYYLTTNRSEESYTLSSPSPKFAFKNLPETHIRAQLFWEWAVYSPCLACNKPYSAPNSSVMICLASSACMSSMWTWVQQYIMEKNETF